MGPKAIVLDKFSRSLNFREVCEASYKKLGEEELKE
jgi:hypothetical protein